MNRRELEEAIVRACEIVGQDSEWANQRDFYIDAVSVTTAMLPERWRERAIEVPTGRDRRYVGVCPEVHDLCASKMARNEQKDRDFVHALSDAGLINARLLRNRLDEISDPRLESARKRVARQFVRSLEHVDREVE